jgi:hypothetical protein
VREYVNGSLVAMLILGIVSLAVPASARASAADDEPSRPEVTSRTALPAPGVLQRSIAVAAHRAALQAPQTGTGVDSRSRMGCRIGAVLMGGAGAAVVTAAVKHAHWASSGATKSPGAAPPHSVGVSVTIGAVLAGAGIFTLAKTCGA